MKIVKLFFATMFVVLLSAFMADAQNVTVSGVVRDASTGEPVPFAAYQIKGTTDGGSTDVNGSYSASVTSDAVLVFSSIGYVTTEVSVNGRAQLDVQLSPDSEMLEETIVVAYGTATRESFTGSAAMVKSEEISKRVTSSVTNALAGTTPGVQIISSSGDPASSSSSIRIRGIGSMSASNSPLIILDGMPYDGTISDINPQDVESISVLKDASASAIYGSRGANGVILITTKKATREEAVIKVDARFGVNSRLIPQYDVIDDPAEYYETWYKLMYYSQYYAGASVADAYAYADNNLFDASNGGLGYQVYTVPEGQKLIGTNFKINPNATLGYDDGEYYYYPDNWYDEAFHNSFRQEYNISASGRKGGLSYYGSVGYLDDGGVVNNSRYQRYSARLNTDYQAKPWLKITSSMSYSHSDSQTPGYTTTYGSSGNIFYIANMIGPIYPLYVRASGTHEILYENGIPVYDANQTNFTRPSMVGNAVRDNEVDSRQNYADVLTGQWGVTATPVKGLSLSANVGVYSDNTRYNALYSQFGSASSVDGYTYVTHTRIFTVNTQYLAEYKTDFDGTKHNLDVLAGFEMYKYKYQYLYGYNDHLFDPYVGELGNALGTSSRSTTSYTIPYMTQGILTRVQYDYDGKYYVSGSFRRDASSRFHPDHRWGNFGSIGFAWILSNENFMSGVSWVDMLKFKASYGVQGNDNLGTIKDSNRTYPNLQYYYFPYMDHYTTSYNEETGEYSLSLAFKGNEELTWESSHSYNAGFEFDLFKGKLSGSIEFFDRITSDLLYNRDVPLSSGNPTGTIPVNVGSISNLGIELVLSGNIMKTRNFNWDWNVNLSGYKNTILELDYTVPDEGIIGSNYIYRVGGSLYNAYVYRFAGVDSETGQAMYYKKVLDSDGNWTGENEITYTFSDADKYDVGSTLPKLYGGFGTSMSAYGFDFSFQCSFQLGGKYYDGTYQALMLTQSSAGNAIHKDILNAWTPENTDTDVPRLDGDYSVGQSPVDRFLISSNYLSINNVTLGYTVPTRLIERVGLAGLRVYVTGDNLAVISARKGVDPRYSFGIGSYTSGSGLNSGSYSSMRNVTAGVTLTF